MLKIDCHGSLINSDYKVGLIQNEFIYVVTPDF